jgi:hypothetical protein
MGPSALHNSLCAGTCLIAQWHAAAQILPELQRRLAEMARRRMQRYLCHSSKEEREHWCAAPS